MSTSTVSAGVFDQIGTLEHENILFCYDPHTRLKAIIAVHDTTLGPAIGGTRMWQYATEAEALTDVIRLSRGMTYKNAIAGLNAGGGKAVIIGDARTEKNEWLLRSFGRNVHRLGGAYVTAEDVGMTGKDMEWIRMETPYVSGLPDYLGGLGDPSPFTAYGTYLGMKAAAKVAYGSDSLGGKRVAVQGVGSVGSKLIEYLMKENAQVIVSDFYEDRLKAIAAQHPVTVVGLDELYDQPMDIYSPCALGATVSEKTISRFTCDIIAGCANNQLANEQADGLAVHQKGILYGPDFLVNCGGVINVFAEYEGLNQEWSWAQVESVYPQTMNVLQRSKQENVPSHQIALAVAQERINKAKGLTRYKM